MPRRHLIELHEQSWYPAFLRRLFQRGLGRSLTLTGAFDHFVEPFADFVRRTGTREILDLCSGSGDAAGSVWNAISPRLDDGQSVKLVLSDLFPNREAYDRLRQAHPATLDFIPESVNALSPPAGTPRVRTIFNAFHHFRPEQARAILADAAAHADGIAVFEVTRNHWTNMLQTLVVLPVASAFLTTFLLRPVSWQQVVFGLFVPIIPFTAVFDGVVSNLRTYGEEDLREMTRGLGDGGFRWEIGRVPVGSTGLQATYLFGWRESEPS